MATRISHSPGETEDLGESWGRAAVAGWVIGLSGELGAGKTQFVKGFARGLGISARVQSPSFALMNVYPGGRLTLFHLDLYRLDTPAQIASAGLEDYLDPAGVTVIEWAERLLSARDPDSKVQSPMAPGQAPPLDPRPLTADSSARIRWIRFETLSESERRLTYEDAGA